MIWEPQEKKNEIVDILGSCKCVKFVPFHPKNLPKNRNFTYMEDPGMDYMGHILYVFKSHIHICRKNSYIIDRKLKKTSP